MSYTSSDVKMRYNEKTYRPIEIKLRKEGDADIIDFINANKEKLGTTGIFREALELYIKESAK